MSPQIYNPPEFTSARQVKEGREEVVARFSRIFDQMKNRPAFGHPLFKKMANLARQALTDDQAKAQFKDQFDTFSQFMLARIFLTMPSIAKTAEYALLHGDYQMFATALQNLREEGADGDVKKMHPLLAEQAFNEIRQYLELPKITMKQAFDKLTKSSSAMKEYARVINEIYSTNPVCASLAQEVASGGDGRTGMMADIYELFEVLKLLIGTERHNKNVLPYFDQHLSLDADGKYREHAENGIECQHGLRAANDAKDRIIDEKTARAGLTTIRHFAEAQEKLFDEIELRVMYPTRQSEEMRSPTHVL